MIKSYKELVVWQKSMALVTAVYQISSKFPQSELFGITNQMRRSAISIPSNIAEGFGRNSSQDYLRFLYIARGSLYEMETQIQIAVSLGFTTHHAEIINMIDEVGKMLNATITKIKDKIRS
ncbi:four helix bundle protein [Capnocytophaga haemolytica]|jgi:S23 ribosomal protein